MIGKTRWFFTSIQQFALFCGGRASFDYRIADALKSLAVLMIGFYVTCALFVFLLLGTVLKLTTGVNIFALLRYLGREFLLILRPRRPSRRCRA